MHNAIKDVIKTLIPPLAKTVTMLQLPFSSEKIPPTHAENAYQELQKVWPNHELVINCQNKVEQTVDVMVVVPVFNVEKYLRACLDSVISQETKYKFSVVAVDDGRTDESGRILDDYASRDSRIKVIHKENGGISSARNAALSCISGRYIIFLDSDDVLLPGAIQTLTSIADENGADIVQGANLVFVDEIPDKKINSGKIKAGSPSNLTGMPWGKIISSSLFESIIFPEGFDFEDSIMAYCINPSSTKTVYTAQKIYGYRNNRTSITKTIKGKPKSLDTIYISLALWKWHLTKFGPTPYLCNKAVRQMALNHNRLSNLDNHESIQRNAFIVERECLTSIFPHETKGIGGVNALLFDSIMDGDYGKFQLISSRIHLMGK